MAADVRAPDGSQNGRGRQASRPREVPARGWLDALKRTRHGIRETNASIVAAGVAFYAFLALVPALIAVVAIYGLVANPADVKDQITSFASAAPRDAQRLLSNQLSSITRGSGGGTGVAALIAIAAALWSASSGIAALNTGLTRREPRTGDSGVPQEADSRLGAHALRRRGRSLDAGVRRGAPFPAGQRRHHRDRQHGAGAGPVAAARDSSCSTAWRSSTATARNAGDPSGDGSARARSWP